MNRIVGLKDSGSEGRGDSTAYRLAHGMDRLHIYRVFVSSGQVHFTTNYGKLYGRRTGRSLAAAGNDDKTPLFLRAQLTLLYKIPRNSRSFLMDRWYS